MVKKFGNTYFNLDFCKLYPANQLRKIYNGELAEDVELMIAEIYPEVPEVPEVPDPTKKEKKEKKIE